MTKTFSFTTNKNNNSTFRTDNKYYKPDYTKILDDIITTSVINKNKYLFNTGTYSDTITSFIDNDPIIITGGTLKADDKFTKATNFLANYKKYKTAYKLPYILGKMYTLTDGTPIIFYDDEIQIGFDTYKYADFNNIKFLNKLNDTTKNIIINIYTTGTSKININIL